jgi:lysophospholipase L1-like esterase
LFCLGVIVLNASAVYGEEKKAVKKERTEWLISYVHDANKNDKPRVLLIGDSITNGYHKTVMEELKGKAYIATFLTSRGIEDPYYFRNLASLLDDCKFDVIHFNNGLHGWHYTDKEYERGYSKLMDMLMKYAAANNTKLMCATSTPVRLRKDLKKYDAGKMKIIEARNNIVKSLAAKNNIPVDDLFALVLGKPELYSKDAIHYNNDGRKLQGKAVAELLLPLLPAKK